MLREKVEKIISQEIKPFLGSHGGDVELIDVTDQNVVKLRLKGACMGCPMSMVTLQSGIGRVLKEKIPEISRVESVE